MITTKTLFKYLTLVNPRNTVIVGVILSAQRAVGGYREGICWISFQYDENDNRSATCAKDKSSFPVFDFKKVTFYLFKKHIPDEWVTNVGVRLPFSLHF